MRLIINGFSFLVAAFICVLIYSLILIVPLNDEEKESKVKANWFTGKVFYFHGDKLNGKWKEYPFED